MRALALETIHERYPETDWLHVYTDGTGCDARSNMGAGEYTSTLEIAEPAGKMAKLEQSS
jgi:hypothetical protein